MIERQNRRAAESQLNRKNEQTAEPESLGNPNHSTQKVITRMSDDEDNPTHDLQQSAIEMSQEIGRHAKACFRNLKIIPYVTNGAPTHVRQPS